MTTDTDAFVPLCNRCGKPMTEIRDSRWYECPDHRVGMRRKGPKNLTEGEQAVVDRVKATYGEQVRFTDGRFYLDRESGPWDVTNFVRHEANKTTP